MFKALTDVASQAAAKASQVAATASQAAKKTITSALPPKDTSGSLKDTTLRSVIFGLKDVSLAKDSSGQLKIAPNQVEKAQFDQYDHVLKVMTQLTRLAYCDSSIIREVMLSPSFGTNDNVTFNNTITAIDAKYALATVTSLTRSPYAGYRVTPSKDPKSIDGRPMLSYITPSITAGNMQPFAQYVGHSSSFTYIVVPGRSLMMKCPFFQNTDLIISFKGSNSIVDFQHDMKSISAGTNLADIMPAGTQMSSDVKDKKISVPQSFINPINEAWSILRDTILKNKPTRLFITGHSLGGAYSSLLSFIIAEVRTKIFPSVTSIHNISFGSPTILDDVARNVFNAHLDSGILTLDRVVSYLGPTIDAITLMPPIFSHPGFQPLHTEFQPEARTGRAYTYERIRKVYQKGGLFGIGVEKGKYEVATLTHMPNKIGISAIKPHLEYFGISYLGGLRVAGMKNPGFVNNNVFNTFIANLYKEGIDFHYVKSSTGKVPSDPSGPINFGSATGGSRKRRILRKRKQTRKQGRK
jgi:hypothetical protein